jgi:hypothetical protein
VSNKSDLDHLSEMDIQWLTANGWTVPGNLAFRRCLEYLGDYKESPPCEYIEQVLMRYRIADDATQIQKIKETLQEILAIKAIFQQETPC